MCVCVCVCACVYTSVCGHQGKASKPLTQTHTHTHTHTHQDTVAEMATDIKAKRTGEVAASADELFRFINKVRGGGAQTPLC